MGRGARTTQPRRRGEAETGGCGEADNATAETRRARRKQSPKRQRGAARRCLARSVRGACCHPAWRQGADDRRSSADDSRKSADHPRSSPDGSRSPGEARRKAGDGGRRPTAGGPLRAEGADRLDGRGAAQRGAEPGFALPVLDTNWPYHDARDGAGGRPGRAAPYRGRYRHKDLPVGDWSNVVQVTARP